ncbi:hypothetical protein HK101_000990 [Irineochytrium annulatum]|nr:hypothetical protein HK101_000990 [Irineochytrium annulatum]
MLCVAVLLFDASVQGYASFEALCSLQKNNKAAYYQCLCFRYSSLIDCFKNNCSADTINLAKYQNTQLADCAQASAVSSSLATSLSLAPAASSGAAAAGDPAATSLTGAPGGQTSTVAAGLTGTTGMQMSPVVGGSGDGRGSTNTVIIASVAVAVLVIGFVAAGVAIWIRRWRVTKAAHLGPADVITSNSPAEGSALELSLRYETRVDKKPSRPARLNSMADAPRRMPIFGSGVSQNEEPIPPPSLDGLMLMSGGAGTSTMVEKSPISAASAALPVAPSRGGNSNSYSITRDAVMPDVATWSTLDVARWLEDKLQLRKAIVNAFIGSGVDGARLVTLTDDDLSVEMGLSEDAKLMFRAALDRLTGDSARDQSGVSPPPYHSRLPSA